MILGLLIINKAGGLVYNNSFETPSTAQQHHVSRPPKLTSNEYLILAGTFHGIHAITSKISPVPSADGLNKSGIELLESGSIRLYCHQTLTGTKFVLSTDLYSTHAAIDVAIKRLVEIYADFVMKNPFYQIEMPIRCELFDLAVNESINTFNLQ